MSSFCFPWEIWNISKWNEDRAQGRFGRGETEQKRYGRWTETWGLRFVTTVKERGIWWRRTLWGTQTWTWVKTLFMTSCHADIHVMSCRPFTNGTQPLNHSITTAIVAQLLLLNLQVYDSYLCPWQNAVTEVNPSCQATFLGFFKTMLIHPSFIPMEV